MKAFSPYAVLAGAVWLGWQVLIAPVLERSPVDIAIRLAPTSPMVLRRAAESELAAGRFDNAGDLARRALSAAPFDVRALSVAGMAIAERDSATANDVLTLAGNWSLRDDPTHAWLMNERLRRGDYASAFGHADTLVRRRKDIRPEIFRLFTAAATQDPRALPPLIDLLAADPPWREAFFDRLYADPQGDALLGGLVVSLQRTTAPLDDRELSRLYGHWLAEERIAAIKAVQQRIRRPPISPLVVDGDFSSASALPPFSWMLNQSASFTAVVTNDDRRDGELSLRVDYDGFGSGAVAHQLLLLSPGTYRLTFQGRSESGVRRSSLAWRLTCRNGNQVAEIRPTFSSADGGWTRFETDFSVAHSCLGQSLTLMTLPGDRRGTRIVSWFDSIRIAHHEK